MIETNSFVRRITCHNNSKKAQTFLSLPAVTKATDRARLAMTVPTE